MRKLILVKHAKPVVDERVASQEWRLSEEGRNACQPLAEALAEFDPVAIVTSVEPKAVETGELLAAALGKPFVQAQDLHEHDRSNVPMMPSRDFISSMALFFRDRRRLVLGRETAQQVAQRFSQAIASVLESHGSGNVVVVTHGTALALFAADHGAGDAFQLFRRLGLPSYASFSCPDFKVLQIVERV
jgi:broad specificity phosphatase PhoE